MKFIPIVIASFTLIIFLNLIYYFTLIHIINFPSYLIYVFFFGLIVLYYLITKKKYYLNKGLLLWIALYLILNTIYYMADGAPGGKEFKFYVPSIVWFFTFIAMSLLYQLDNNELIITRRSIVVALMIGVLFLLYDFTHPGFFVADFSDHYVSGRAAATYGNSNIVGAVFILGLILTIDIIPNKLKFPYIVIVFIGILTTISRSNIMIYFVILVIMAIQKKISRVSAIWLLSIIVSLILWLAIFGLDILQKDFNVNVPSDVTDRLEFFTDFKHYNNSHNEERENVLMAALSMFADKPILGNGLGSTRMWHYRVGPHNTFALTWADFGLIGVLIIPSFLFFTTYEIIRNSRKEYRDIGILFIIYFTFSSLFSHNMLEQIFNLCGAVIISTLGIKNKLYKG